MKSNVRFAVLTVLVTVLVATGAMAAGGAPTQTAATAPTVTMPVHIPTSSLELESLALSEVWRGNLYGGSAGPVLQGGTMSVDVYATDPDIRVMLDKLQQCKLSFDVGDPGAQQWIGENLLDQNGNMLFWGMNSFYPQKSDSGKWVKPDWATHIALQMNSEIPIASGISEAHAIVSYTDGSTRWVNLWVNNGQVFYPTWLLGAEGQVVFTPIGGGKPTIYDINSGAQVPPTNIEDGNIQSTISNLIILDNPEYITFGGVGKAGGGINPLYQITLDEATSALLVEATAPNGEEATSVTYRLVDGGEPVTVQISGRGGLALEAGVYHLFFGFPTFGQDQPSLPNYPPCDGGCG